MIYTAKGKINTQQEISEYFPLVKKIAQYIHKKINYMMELDDLIQAGMIGLIDAISKYNSQNNATFETYATIRIKGSIIDEIRRSDYLSQEDRSALKKINEIKNQNQSNGIHNSKIDIAKEAGISLTKLAEIESLDFSFASIDSEEVRDLVDNISTDFNVVDLIDEKQKINLVMTEVNLLSDREKTIMGLYYQDECTLKEIAEIMNLTEARVSQIHSEIIKKIKSKVNKK